MAFVKHLRHATQSNTCAWEDVTPLEILLYIKAAVIEYAKSATITIVAALQLYD